MKQSLQLNIGQRLTITPQLQQAIKLLQLSSMDVLSEIQEALETNPMLEVVEPSESTAEQTDEILSEIQDIGNGADADEVDAGNAEEDWEAWSYRYDGPTRESHNYNDNPDVFDIDRGNAITEGLQEHLIWQMRMTPFSNKDRRIAEAIIEGIDEDGYLSASLDEIASISIDIDEVDIDEVGAVLHQLQNFDPPGVAARSLKESLLIQLRHLDDDQTTSLALQIIENNLELLAKRDYKSLAQQLHVNDTDLHDPVALIKSLNPRPGNAVATTDSTHIVPDVIVTRRGDAWHIELNPSLFPGIQINQHYQMMIRRGDKSSTNRYLQENLQQARWFVRSLQTRHDTLLRVSQAIIGRQNDFLHQGAESMRPLRLYDIADEVGLHESTISRTVNHKYILTPQGLFELKYFFSGQIESDGEEAVSATAIRSRIRKLIEQENPTRPVSDNTIAGVLKEQGYHIARRTIAKYREQMGIPSSSQRRSFA
ncbi:MAG: RNA polymerase factor sigma-54 [Arenicellales bacterium]|nr:RNA polymerase factor sigma-54 [Arenicellales bacterium]